MGLDRALGLTATEQMLVRLAVERKQRTEAKAKADFDAAVQPIRESFRVPEGVPMSFRVDADRVVLVLPSEEAGS